MYTMESVDPVDIEDEYDRNTVNIRFPETHVDISDIKDPGSGINPTRRSQVVLPDYLNVTIDLRKFFKNDKIHVTGTWEEPLFSGMDVAAFIGDTNHRRILRNQKMYRENKDYVLTPGATLRQRHIYFTERGLYAYLISSSLPRALEFRDQVCDAIQTLRRHGEAVLRRRFNTMKEELWQRERDIFMYREMYNEESANRRLAEDRTTLLKLGADREFRWTQESSDRDLAAHMIAKSIYDHKYRIREDGCSNHKFNTYLPMDFTAAHIRAKDLDEIAAEARSIMRHGLHMNTDYLFKIVDNIIMKYTTPNP